MSYDEELDEREYSPSDDDLRGIYAATKTIAVVGASADDSKAAHRIPVYLQRQG